MFRRSASQFVKMHSLQSQGSRRPLQEVQLGLPLRLRSSERGGIPLRPGHGELLQEPLASSKENKDSSR